MKSSDGWSAHCRSSRNSTNGCSGAATWRSRAIKSARKAHLRLAWPELRYRGLLTEQGLQFRYDLEQGGRVRADALEDAHAP